MADMTRNEWKRRYAARIMERAGWPEVPAIQASETAAQEYERMERAAGNAVGWANPEDSPEDAADEEMSYWEDDGRMRIQDNPRTASFTIFDADKLDPVTVFLQDFGGGCGRLIVECWCTAWAAYWGAMGTSSVREFVLDAHADYIVGRMLPQDRKHLKRDEAYLLRIVRAVQQALRDGAGVPEVDRG